MCLPRYQRMPGGKYKGLYGPCGTEWLWFLSCVLCVWASAIVGVVVAIAATDVLLGVVAALGGLVLGVAAASFPFPSIDQELLRLGPGVVVWYVALPFIGPVVAIAVGAAVLLGRS